MLVLVSHKSCSPRCYPQRPRDGSLLFAVKPMNRRPSCFGGQGAVQPMCCSSRGLGPSLVPTVLSWCRLCLLNAVGCATDTQSESHTYEVYACDVFVRIFSFNTCGVCPCVCACASDRQGDTEPKKLFPWTSFNGEVNVQLLNRIRYGLLSYTRKYPGCLASKIR